LVVTGTKVSPPTKEKLFENCLFLDKQESRRCRGTELVATGTKGSPPAKRKQLKTVCFR
jgi:hypothetical protein